MGDIINRLTVTTVSLILRLIKLDAWVLQVRMANRERQRLSRLQKKEIGLATMLLCVVVVFLLCNVWALISNVAESFYGITVDKLVKVSNLLVTINSSVNFVIYVIFGEKFKRLFFKLFFPRGVWLCGWHPVNGRGGPGGHGDHGAMDDSEATCNGAAFECRQLGGGGSEKSKRSRRSRRHHHHHQSHHVNHGCHDHHGGGSKPENHYGGTTGSAGHRGTGNGGAAGTDDRGYFAKAPTTSNSGVIWEHSTTTTTTNVHQF